MQMRRHAPLLCALAALWAAAPAFAQSDGVTISATYTLVMDRLRPDPRPDVRTVQSLVLRLSGVRRVDENWQARSGRFSSETRRVRAIGGSAQEGRGVWRVLPGNRIQRQVQHPQSVTTLTIMVDRGDRCVLDVTSALKPGFSEYKFRRQSTGGVGYFANRRVVDVACTVVK